MERYYKRKSSIESSSSPIHDELEYNIAKDAAFCLCCYLFKPVVGDQGGGKSFVVDGFSSWKKNERLQGHVGGVNNSHNQAWRKYQNDNLRAVLSKDVPEHLKLTTPSIQKDILNAIAVKTTNAIVRELGDGMFSIVFDKSWDASMEEQFIVSFRYVESRGYVIERFLGIKQIYCFF
ncbi:hypothetical protein ACSBR1_012671 [Camellia fascicularis]